VSVSRESIIVIILYPDNLNDRFADILLAQTLFYGPDSIIIRIC